ncbi:hypothetical protein GGI07_003643 [Coemansia sp. Benny D115]|nr:hypothetical protein GGI07_003643 [Coemansia sp. Benny D115]
MQSLLTRTSRAANLASKVAFGRQMSSTSSSVKKGLVLGISADSQLFGATQAKITAEQQQHILTHARALGHTGASGSVHLMLSSDLTQQIALVGLGAPSAKTLAETTRVAVANGIKRLCANKVESVSVAPMPCAKAAAEGATLALYGFDKFKAKKNGQQAKVTLAGEEGVSEWTKGQIFAEAQNWARDLMNTPANHMTPQIFAEEVKKEVGALNNVQVNVYDQAWVEEQRMGGLLAVSRGSEEPLRFVEIIYRGDPSSNEVPLALVGKGITFDTGGYSLKPGKHMDLMKGDMGGGATVVAAMRAIALLQLRINVVATVPLCENMISGRATKVSDIYTSRAGLTVEVMNTDAEGRIVLADALHYTKEVHSPQTIVDVATLTGAMVVALGELYTGIFTPSPRLWSRLERASEASDEPIWRMPLHDAWDKMLKSPVADLSNIGNKAEAGSCTAAAFLRHFVRDSVQKPDESKVSGDQNDDESLPRWAHLDIAGPMESSSSDGHHHRGMSGRPTRLLVELASQLSKNPLV